LIEFKNVSKVYDDGFEAIKNLDLTVNEGELLTLIGPSGCGKTTTMKMINRLIDPTSGQILIEGEDIHKKDPVLLRRNIGYVIQQIGLFPHMTIEDNIAVVPKLKKWPKEKYVKRVNELLDLVGLDPNVFKKRYPSELSGGQQQRIGVIRALAGEPPIVLMDEPFSALDPISREQLQDELIKLQEEINKTIVFVTHDMDEAIKIANRIAIMRDGELVQVDHSDRILRYPKDDFVRDFIGEQRLGENQGVPTAKDLMMEKVVTCKPGRGLAEAFNLMKKHRVDQLYIVDRKDTLLGVIDLETLSKRYREEDKSVSDIMETELQTVSEDQLMAEVVDQFTKVERSTLPVVQGDRLVGIITRGSMVRGMTDWQRRTGGEPAL
jgi:osmoprotectant transport system ATP-binding protein